MRQAHKYFGDAVRIIDEVTGTLTHVAGQVRSRHIQCRARSTCHDR
ncbi:Uncharacterised protein [Mycobacteroides abscessus subsp. abscessus]|nr:Uncharacterised protein [Mycobacteroides abscessus]CPZ73251.1 Uncharacterised protein [Mycobacteroides abscessus]SKW51796.1 Uncharacterised protein [Mycobacteroides abscessus subsp. abscessus]SLF25964.1 Uncharacterised protein [Mycobacteroides abscessus subsp. massiliense]